MPENIVHLGTWGENEEPSFASTIKYRTKSQKVDADGFILMTYGALYIFKKRLLGKPAIRHHISYLQIAEVHQERKFATIYYRDHPCKSKPGDPLDLGDRDPPNPAVILDKNVMEKELNKDGTEIKLSDYENITLYHNNIHSIVITMYQIVCKCLFRVDIIKAPIFKSKKIKFILPTTTNTDGMIEKRCLFVAHYCYFTAKNIESASYFSAKWNGEPNLIISKGFHPGAFAVPYAVAVGFEEKLNTVCFDLASFTHFDSFIDALLVSAIHVNKIVFNDYPLNRHIPFRFRDIRKTRIKHWAFHQCAITAIADFAEASIKLPESVDALTIAKFHYDQTGTDQLFELIKNSPNLRTLKELSLVSLTFKRFPLIALRSLIGGLTNLNRLELRNLGEDGSQLLKSVCDSGAHLRWLCLSGNSFEEDIPPLSLPDGIVVFDVSNCRFTGNVFAQLMRIVTDKDFSNKLFLLAKHIDVPLSGLDGLTDRKPTIVEFDFSDNLLESHSIDPLFTFLQTQTAMRQLCMMDIKTDDQLKLRYNIASLMNNVGLHGVDISGELQPDDYNILINAMTGMRSLKRICIPGSRGDNAAISALNNVLLLHDGIEEIVCDGFKPTKVEGVQPIVELWESIALARSIVACDLPKNDLASLGIDIRAFMSDTTTTELQFNKRLAPPFKRKPMTQQQRIIRAINDACGIPNEPLPAVERPPETESEAEDSEAEAPEEDSAESKSKSKSEKSDIVSVEEADAELSSMDSNAAKDNARDADERTPLLG